MISALSPSDKVAATVKSLVPPTAPVSFCGCCVIVIVLVTDSKALLDVTSDAPVALTLHLK